jgi:hypothetical protein
VRIYGARPVTAYGSDLDARQLAALARHFPEATVLDPAELFESNEEWLVEWPGILARLDLLAVWADTDSIIGAGVLKELSDAIGAFVPVVVLDRRGRLRCFGGLRASGGVLLSRRAVGRLLYGPLLAASDVVAMAADQAEVPA